MEKMTDSRKIEPCKIFVRYIPEQTTADELKLFFSTCGNVTCVHIIPPKNNRLKANTNYYVISFIIFETQQDADRAVGELNGKIFTNKKGFSGTITITHCQLKPVTKFPEGNFHEDKSSENHLEIRQQEKNVSDQDKMELWKRFQANEEKLRQIHNKTFLGEREIVVGTQARKDPAMEQELKDLKMTIDQLQAKKDDLEPNVEALKGEINILELKLKLKELDQEQIKLKNAQ